MNMKGALSKKKFDDLFQIVTNEKNTQAPDTLWLFGSKKHIKKLEKKIKKIKSPNS